MIWEGSAYFALDYLEIDLDDHNDDWPDVDCVLQPQTCVETCVEKPQTDLALSFDYRKKNLRFQN